MHGTRRADLRRPGRAYRRHLAPPARSQAGAPACPGPPPAAGQGGRQVGRLPDHRGRGHVGLGSPGFGRRPLPRHPGANPSYECWAPIVPPIDASAVVHARSSSRHPPDPLTAGLFPQRSPPRLLTGAACGALGSPPARRTRRTYLHHWHSTVHAGDLLHRLTPLSGHTAERRFPCTAHARSARVLRRPGRRRAGPDMTAPPELVLARACRAGAQVASRRKAHHGSSRTVFHEGSGQARGTLTHRREYNARPASAIPAAGTTSEIAPDLPGTARSGIPSAPPREVTAWKDCGSVRIRRAGRRFPFTAQLRCVAAASWSDGRPLDGGWTAGWNRYHRSITWRRLRGRRRRCK